MRHKGEYVARGIADARQIINGAVGVDREFIFDRAVFIAITEYCLSVCNQLFERVFRNHKSSFAVRDGETEVMVFRIIIERRAAGFSVIGHGDPDVEPTMVVCGVCGLVGEGGGGPSYGYQSPLFPSL